MSIVDNKFELLSFLKSNSCKRRVIHELQLLEKQNWYINLEKDEKDKNVIITLIENERENNIYSFKVDECYPFRPPKIHVNYKNYLELLKINSLNFNKILRKTFKKDCFCCESIICPNNWNPSHRIDKIIREIKDVIQMKKNIIKKYYADIIIQKYLIKDISFDSWLF